MLTIVKCTTVPTSVLANNGISWKGEMAWPLPSPDNKMVAVSNMEKCAVINMVTDLLLFCLHERKQFFYFSGWQMVLQKP